MTQEQENALTFSGQVSEHEIYLVAAAPGSDRLVNILPNFEFIDVVATTQARLGTEVLYSREQSMTFLVVR
jgi:hypothetical protein